MLPLALRAGWPAWGLPLCTNIQRKTGVNTLIKKGNFHKHRILKAGHFWLILGWSLTLGQSPQAQLAETVLADASPIAGMFPSVPLALWRCAQYGDQWGRAQAVGMLWWEGEGRAGCRTWQWLGAEQGVTAGSHLGWPLQQLQLQCSVHFSWEGSTSPASATVPWEWPGVLLALQRTTPGQQTPKWASDTFPKCSSITNTFLL